MRGALGTLLLCFGNLVWADRTTANPAGGAGSESAWMGMDRWPQETEEQRLLLYLAKHYQKFTRPVRNVSRAVTVHLGLTLIHIADMDEKNQVLTLNVWLDQQWEDEFMRWNPADFGGLLSMRIPEVFLWTPDIVLYNNADHYYGEKLASRAMVYFNGTVFWPIPARLKSTCRTDVTYFPFDSQHCYLKFGSWTYHGDLLNITYYRDEVDLSTYVKSGEFDLVATHQIRRVVKYSCCTNLFPDIIFFIHIQRKIRRVLKYSCFTNLFPDIIFFIHIQRKFDLVATHQIRRVVKYSCFTNLFPDIIVFIHIQRKVLFYVYNAVIPCSMLTCLTLLVFWLPPDSGEKITLGVTVLLAFSVFMLNIAERMPETSDSLPLIGCYLIVVMGLTSVSVLMTVLILHLHHRGPLKSEVPPWMRWLILDKLRRFLGMPSHKGRARQASLRDSSAQTFTPMEEFLSPRRTVTETALRSPSFVCTCDEAAQPLRDADDLHSPSLSPPSPSLAPNGPASRRDPDSPGPPTQPQPNSAPLHQRARNMRLSLLARTRLEKETLKTLDWLRSSVAGNRYAEDRVAEWRSMAEILDRMLFWVFLLITVIISAVLLIIIPAVTRLMDTKAGFVIAKYGISLPDDRGVLQ